MHEVIQHDPIFELAYNQNQHRQLSIVFHEIFHATLFGQWYSNTNWKVAQVVVEYPQTALADRLKSQDLLCLLHPDIIVALRVYILMVKVIKKEKKNKSYFEDGRSSNQSVFG